MLAGINRSRRVEHHRLPGVRGTLLAQVQKHFGKESRVQVGIRLKLHFDKEHWPVRVVSRRQHHSIDAESGLFEFYRPKAILRSVSRGPFDQVEQELRKGVKQAIEKRVRFHLRRRSMLDNPALSQCNAFSFGKSQLGQNSLGMFAKPWCRTPKFRGGFLEARSRARLPHPTKQGMF